MFDYFSQTIIQNPQLAYLIFEDSSDINEIRARWLTFMRFDWFESIVIQKYKYKSIPDDIYNHWINILEYELSIPFIYDIWEKYGKFYHPLLQDEINKKIINKY